MFAKRRRLQIRRNRLILPLKNVVVVPFKKFWLVSVVVLLAAVVYLFFRSDLFLIHQIKVQSSSQCVSEDQIKDAAGAWGKSFFTIDTSDLSQKILNKFIVIKSVEIKKDWPDQLILTVECRKPLLQVIKANLPGLNIKEASSSADIVIPGNPGAVLLADVQGVIFKTQPNLDLSLPVFLIEEELSIGSKLDSIAQKAAIDAIETSQQEGFFSQSVVFLDDLIQVNFSNGMIVKMNKAPLPNKLSDLDLILKKIKLDGKQVRLIDLRFDKPIIVYR
ncbi:FtsQ-type POTRA domain-containing protein [Candidatus Daviesbacteria bacterium]|nr:FtsQ-type POTRA domain-containing protein [Candidatus Daviesbacteria bacterium]